MEESPGPVLIIRPLTPYLWPQLKDLFGSRGAVGDCWCMYWRIGATYRRRPAAENRSAFLDVVQTGPPPGLLAFRGNEAVGWCQLTSRDAVPWLEKNWRLERVDDISTFSLTCLYVRIGQCRRGISAALIHAALNVARQANAPALEAYPLDARVSPSSTGTGYLSTFLAAGFKVVARRTSARPIVRHDLKHAPRSSPTPKG